MSVDYTRAWELSDYIPHRSTVCYLLACGTFAATLSSLGIIVVISASSGSSLAFAVYGVPAALGTISVAWGLALYAERLKVLGYAHEIYYRAQDVLVHGEMNELPSRLVVITLRNG